MPVHDLGYRNWTGRRMPRLLRPWVVARGGVSLIWRRRWLRMALIVGWLPIALPTIAIFAFEFSASNPEMRGVVMGMLRGPIQRPDLAMEVARDPTAVRHEVWSTLILFFFRYPQLVAMVLLVGLIAPLLVSYDLRSKAYLMYFSRPLTPGEYILGKSAVIWFFLAAIVTVPALALYLTGVLLSPDLSVIADTWDIPLRILAATVVLIVPTTTVALVYSSLTSESRYASFAWFATFVMGFVSYSILTYSVAAGPMRGTRGQPPDIDYDRWRLLSPYHTLGKVEGWVFGMDPTPGSVIPAMVILVIVTVVGIAIIRHRIIARLSV